MLNCALGTIPAGGQVVIRVPVHVDAAATASTVTNDVVVSTATPAPPAAPPSTASVTSDLTPLADLTLTKTAPAQVVAGTPIAWSLTATNAGPSVAAGVVLTDTLPSGIGPVVAVPSQGACDQVGDVLTCQLGDIAPGGSIAVTVTVSGNVPADFLGAHLINTAAIDSPAGGRAGAVQRRADGVHGHRGRDERRRAGRQARRGDDRARDEARWTHHGGQRRSVGGAQRADPPINCRPGHQRPLRLDGLRQRHGHVPDPNHGSAGSRGGNRRQTPTCPPASTNPCRR